MRLIMTVLLGVVAFASWVAWSLRTDGSLDTSASPTQIDPLCNQVDPRWTWSGWNSQPTTACRVFAPLFFNRKDPENREWLDSCENDVDQPHTATLCLWGGRPAFCFRGTVDHDLHIGTAGYSQSVWLIPSADRGAVDPTVIDLPSPSNN